jgi:hypothetical protein
MAQYPLGMQSTVFVHSGEFVLRNVGNEGVLVPVRNRVGDLDSIYVMSPVAVRVWSLIDGVNETPAITRHIVDEYEVEPAVAAQDVNDLLAALEEAELIHRA